MFSTITDRTASTCACRPATFEAASGWLARWSAAARSRGENARSRPPAGAERASEVAACLSEKSERTDSR